MKSIMKIISCWHILKNSHDRLTTWCQCLSTSLWLLHLRQTDSTVIILEKQISRQSIWFECCHYKWSLDQRSDWLQTILCHSEKLHLLTVLSGRLCLLTVSLESLHLLIVSTLERRSLVFSIWLKTFKSSIHCADRYLVNFVKNQKEISHLLWLRMKFWERWIMFLCFSRRWFEISS